MENVEVKVTGHVRIVEGVVGEDGEVEAHEAGGCGDGAGVVGEGVVAVVEGGIVIEDDVKVEEHVVRFTEASKRERE